MVRQRKQSNKHKQQQQQKQKQNHLSSDTPKMRQSSSSRNGTIEVRPNSGTATASRAKKSFLFLAVFLASSGIVVGVLFYFFSAGLESWSTPSSASDTISGPHDEDIIPRLARSRKKAPRKKAPATTPSSTTGTTTNNHNDNDNDANHAINYTKRGTYILLDQWPHDPKAFCQGLEVKNSTHLYESIGLYRQSAVRIVETVTGRVTLETRLPDAYFGEGITYIPSPNLNCHHEPYLIQLTWREKIALIYNAETMQEISQVSPMPYQTTSTQGWGIAYDTHRNVVYVSDGTEFIHVWELQYNMNAEDGHIPSISYVQTERLVVHLQLPGQPASKTVTRINELEYDPHTQTLMANVWFEDTVVRIDPLTGLISRIYDLSDLYQNREPGSDVLNGIATLPDQPGHLYVTGKLWPVLFWIELVDLD